MGRNSVRSNCRRGIILACLCDFLFVHQHLLELNPDFPSDVLGYETKLRYAENERPFFLGAAHIRAYATLTQRRVVTWIKSNRDDSSYSIATTYAPLVIGDDAAEGRLRDARYAVHLLYEYNSGASHYTRMLWRKGDPFSPPETGVVGAGGNGRDNVVDGGGDRSGSCEGVEEGGLDDDEHVFYHSTMDEEDGVYISHYSAEEEDGVVKADLEEELGGDNVVDGGDDRNGSSEGVEEGGLVGVGGGWAGTGQGRLEVPPSHTPAAVVNAGMVVQLVNPPLLAQQISYF